MIHLCRRQSMLKKASIIGKGFTLDEIVETQKSINQNEIVPIINELQKKEIIDITELSPEVQYLFNNVLMRQAIYSTILLSEKVSLHNRVALFYEENTQAGLLNTVSCFHHFHLGENKEKHCIIHCWQLNRIIKLVTMERQSTIIK